MKKQLILLFNIIFLTLSAAQKTFDQDQIQKLNKNIEEIKAIYQGRLSIKSRPAVQTQPEEGGLPIIQSWDEQIKQKVQMLANLLDSAIDKKYIPSVFKQKFDWKERKMISGESKIETVNATIFERLYSFFRGSHKEFFSPIFVMLFKKVQTLGDDSFNRLCTTYPHLLLDLVNLSGIDSVKNICSALIRRCTEENNQDVLHRMLTEPVGEYNAPEQNRIGLTLAQYSLLLPPETFNLILNCIKKLIATSIKSMFLELQNVRLGLVSREPLSLLVHHPKDFKIVEPKKILVPFIFFIVFAALDEKAGQQKLYANLIKLFKAFQEAGIYNDIVSHEVSIDNVKITLKTMGDAYKQAMQSQIAVYQEKLKNEKMIWTKKDEDSGYITKNIDGTEHRYLDLFWGSDISEKINFYKKSIIDFAEKFDQFWKDIEQSSPEIKWTEQ